MACVLACLSSSGGRADQARVRLGKLLVGLARENRHPLVRVDGG